MKKACSKVYRVYEDRLYGDGKLYSFLAYTVKSLPIAKGLAKENYLKTGRSTWVEDANGKLYVGYFVD